MKTTQGSSGENVNPAISFKGTFWWNNCQEMFGKAVLQEEPEKKYVDTHFLDMYFSKKV